MNTHTPDPKHVHTQSHSHSHSFSHSLTAADLKLLSTPSIKSAKGKQKEEETWQFGWWDYAPLLEGRKPPVHWTSSSTIFVAHASEPRVICLQYPSNRQFSLPNPPSLTTNPASHEPPTIISGSARDSWLFAYLPGIDTEAVGCLWRKGSTVDSWMVKEWWTFARGAGVVTARWLNPEREWTTSESGTTIRLPPLGPFIPLLHPVLFIITESHLCNVYYVHPQAETIKMLSASLSRRSISRDGEARSPGERVDGPRGLGRVSHAAIGFGYDESAILVATHSVFVPSSASESFTTSSVDLTMQLSLPAPGSEPAALSDWDNWRDEHTVELCEVNISIQGFNLHLATNPLPSIPSFPPSNVSLIDLTFVSSLPSFQHGQPLPSTPTQTHRLVTPQSSPAMAHAHVMQSPGRTAPRPPTKGPPLKPSLERLKGKPKSALYLLCTTLDLGQFATPLKSEITLFTYLRNQSVLEHTQNNWLYKRVSHMSIPSSVVMHLSAAQPASATQNTSALIGYFNTECLITKHAEGKALTIGKLSMLRLPELQLDDSWESTAIICPMTSFGVELPFNLAVSPNHSLVCAISTSTFAQMHSIHPHPFRLPHTQDNITGTNNKTTKHYATLLEVAVQRRSMLSDIVHFFTLRSTSIQVVEEDLAYLIRAFEINNNGFPNVWMQEVLGSAVETYRAKSAKSEVERDDLMRRSDTGLEICSFIAFIRAWEDTADGDGYDLDAVWYLVAICGYFFEFLEKLLKECVLFASDEGPVDYASAAPAEDPSRGKNAKFDDDPFEAHGGTGSKEISSVDLRSTLIHLSHPFALEVFTSHLSHVNRFRFYLSHLTAKGENAQMAKDVLFDVIDSSEIDMDALESVLKDIRGEVKAHAEHSPGLVRKGLASLKPPAQFAMLMQSIVTKIVQGNVVDKARLFIKPDDLIDGMLGLAMNAPAKKHTRDIVSKSFLPGVRPAFNCVRCEGKSELAYALVNSPGQMSVRWTMWERSWQSHCICGGLWWINRQ